MPVSVRSLSAWAARNRALNLPPSPLLSAMHRLAVSTTHFDSRSMVAASTGPATTCSTRPARGPRRPAAPPPPSPTGSCAPPLHPLRLRVRDTTQEQDRAVLHVADQEQERPVRPERYLLRYCLHCYRGGSGRHGAFLV